MAKRNLVVGIMMNRGLQSMTGRTVCQPSYTRVLGLTRVYLSNPTGENERLVYDFLQQFSQSQPSSHAIRRIMRLRLFMFNHERQRQARSRFKRFVLREQELENNRNGFGASPRPHVNV